MSAVVALLRITPLRLAFAAVLLLCGVALAREDRTASPAGPAADDTSAADGGGGGAAVSSSSSSSSLSSSSPGATVERLVHWIEANGGHVDSRQVVREDEDSGGLRGVYADDFIPKGATLLSLPPHLIISPDAAEGDRADQCGTASALKREMELGADSKFAPYAQMLDEYADGGGLDGLMDTWSAPGLALLDEVLGRYLPPRERGGHHRHLWTKFCEGDPEKDPAGFRAALIMASRATTASHGDGAAPPNRERVRPISMIPYFDLYNHRNAPHQGVTKIVPDPTSPGAHLEMRALRDIQPGEQIYNKYMTHTAGILRDFGFVEQPPWQWTIPAPNGRRGTYVLEFTLREDGGVEITSEEEAPVPARLFLKDELNRLGEVRNTVKRRREKERGQAQVQGGSANNRPNRNEELLVWQYHRAITRAIKAVLEELDGSGGADQQAKGTGASVGDEL